MTQTQRRLAAIMLADVAGYSGMMERDESRTFQRLRVLRDELAFPEIGRHGGRIIKSTGDGFLAEFSSANAALECGIAVQKLNIAAQASVADADRLRLRIGINLGDIIVDGDDVSGDGVNVAARLEPLSPLDGLCISLAVKDQVRQELGVEFEDIGEQKVKNLTRTVRAFRVHITGHTAAGTLPATSPAAFMGNKRFRQAAMALGVAACLAAAVYGIRTVFPRVFTGIPVAGAESEQINPLSIVVLPFANLTGDATQDYLADGLTSSITADLSRIRDAFVISTTAAQAYRNKQPDLRQVHDNLGVRFVLQGTVQRSGNTIRIGAQLSDSSNQRQLWSEIFSGEASDLFSLQDQVTTRIGNSIGREMVIVSARESEKRKSDPQVTDLLLRARAMAFLPRTPSFFTDVEPLYRSALKLEADNTSAMTGLAGVMIFRAQYFGHTLTQVERQRYLEEARSLAVKVKQADPDNPVAHLVLAMYAEAMGDYDAQLESAKTASSLAPKDQRSLNLLAHTLIYGGDVKRALPLLKQAYDLDPRHPIDQLPFNLGWANFIAGNYDASIEWFNKSIALSPSYTDCYGWLAMAYLQKGDLEKSKEMAARLWQADPKGSFMTRRKPLNRGTKAYRDFYENTFIPLARKAGVSKE